MTIDDVKRCINAGGVVWCENVIQRGDARETQSNSLLILDMKSTLPQKIG